MYKKVSVLILSIVLLFSSVTSHAIDNSIKVYVDNTQVQFDVPPQIINNSTMVPLRAIFMALGAKVDYDPSTKMISGTKGDIAVNLKVGESQGTVNGAVSKLDTPAQLINNRTLVPARFISEALNAYVRWNDTTKSIYITSNPLRISYIDVGQADCILIQQGNSNILIDAGNNDDKDTIINYLKGHKITKLDVLVLTHPHEDHIGAADDVINYCPIDKVYMPKISANTDTFIDLVSAIKKQSLNVNTPASGDSFNIGSMSCTVLAPNSSSYDDLNNYSIVLQVKYGNKTFLFTGDAESKSEDEISSKGYNIKSDVLKVGHHGSSSSTSISFLNTVKPKYAVISVGKNNEYGLPTKSTMEKLKAWGVTVFRTDECGTVVATSDGEDIKFNCKAGSYNYSGDGKNASTSDSKVTPQPTLTPQPTPTLAPIMTPTPVPQDNTSKIVYYTPSGKSYHSTIGCPTLSRSKNILSGTIEEAIKSGHSDPCDKCVK